MLRWSVAVLLRSSGNRYDIILICLCHSCCLLIYYKETTVYHWSSILILLIGLLNQMQTELSVQFDDLFNKAWEDDVIKFMEDGLNYLQTNILVLCSVFMLYLI